MGLTTSVQHVNVQQLQNELDKGIALLVDVRETQEWDAGHLKKAISLPLSDIGSENIPDLLSQHKRVYLHCVAGVRVKSAKRKLEKMGFSGVVALKEGYADLANLGFEITG